MRRALKDQMILDGRLTPTGSGCVCAMEEGIPEWVFWDDVNREPLDSQGVVRARKEEISELHKHGVYEKVLASQCLEATGKKPI